VNKCLTKDRTVRPNYSGLLEMSFIKKQTDWDVAAYVNGVLDQMPKDFQCEPAFS